jgi:hypothetical protein
MMKDLVGKSFVIADDRYRIVDVQQLGRDALIYAESVYAERDHRAPGELGGPVRSPARTAFHYRDIAALLESGLESERPAAATGS